MKKAHGKHVLLNYPGFMENMCFLLAKPWTVLRRDEANWAIARL